MDELTELEVSAPGNVVGTLRLPFGVSPLADLVQLLVDEYGPTLRMRYDGEFAVFYLPSGLS